MSASLATRHDDPDARLGWVERVGYGSGQLGINAINGILGSFLTVYFTNVALLDAAVISTIIAVSKLFDGVSDIIVGRLVDRTKSRLGKARSWLLRVCVPFAVAVMLLFLVPPNWPGAVKYVYVFVMYNVVNAVFMTSMLVPFYSMISLMTRNSYERGLLGNIQQIFQTLGNVIVNAVFVWLLARFSSDAANPNTQQAYTLTMLCFCAVMVLLALVTVFTTKERVHEGGGSSTKAAASAGGAGFWESVKALVTNKYWVMMFVAMLAIFFVIIFNAVGAIYYCMYVFYDMSQYSWLSNSMAIAQFAIMFATPLLMARFGKEKIYIAGIGISTLGYLGFGLFGFSVPIMIVCNILKGLGLGMAGGMAMGIVADTLTYGRLRTGIDAVGMGNAGVSAAQKIGMGLGTAVFGWVLSASGFDGSLDLEGLRQPESVTTAIQLMFNWIPFTMFLLVFVALAFSFRLERDIEALRAQGDAQEPLAAGRPE
ncbi:MULTISPECIES: MFS transporter [unclassified Actinomyces]|uniref:MFS transporter n=1 Tax=unclassified Actinomyces TaxID=2609248 RepID=UPI000D59AF23|nr:MULTISPECIES: MFS transporter [unclassified Actinomyces]RAX21396.1 MFS transporter [Actinomyces sp. Z3]